ncbi:MAG: pentapeptide repeat-containing protein, partial [Methylorubrum rhodinum]
MTQAGTARAAIEATIARAAGKPLSLSDGRLSGLDLRRANLRPSRLNRVLPRGGGLRVAAPDQAGLKTADLGGAKLVGARFFGPQVRGRTRAEPTGAGPGPAATSAGRAPA